MKAGMNADVTNATTLEELLQSAEPMASSDALAILRNCAQAVDALPEHRQLTPAGIALRGAEFQVEIETAPSVTGTEHTLPPPERAAYLSPEEVLGTPPDRRSIEFSLAAIAYKMLTGAKPFRSFNLSALVYEICAAAPLPADVQNPQLSRGTAAVLQRALSKDPTQRFESCGAFVEALQAAISQTGGDSPAEVAAAPDAPATATFADLPIARRRLTFDLEPEQGAVPERETSLIARIGAFRMVLIGVVAASLLVFLFDRHSTPAIPQQTVDPRVGPVAPPPPPEDNGDDDNTVKPARAVKTQPEPPPKSPKPTAPVPSRAPAAGRAPRVPIPQLSGMGSAAVELLTEPPGASVMVDGHSGKSCTAPCTLLLTAGRHVLSAQLEGYSTAQRIFNTPETSSLIIPLGANLGTLIVSSFPAGATLSVDGQEAGRSPLTLHLRAGEHRLDAVYGDKVRHQVVNIQADSIQGATFDLQ